MFVGDDGGYRANEKGTVSMTMPTLGERART